MKDKTKYTLIGIFFGFIGTLFLITLALIVASVSFNHWASGIGGDRELEAPVLPNASANFVDFGSLKLHHLNGKGYDADELKGNVVLFNYWATWCAPCMEELPTIIELQKKMKSDKIKIILVSDERLETIQKFVKKKTWPMDFFFQEDPVDALFDIYAIPSVVIVDKKGEIVFQDSGAADWSDDSVVQYLLQLTEE